MTSFHQRLFSAAWTLLPHSTVLLLRIGSISLLFSSRYNWGRHSIPRCSPFFDQFHIPAEHRRHLCLQVCWAFPPSLAGYLFFSWGAAYSYFAQHSEKVELVHPFALSNIPLAQPRRTATAVEDHAPSLRYAVLAESPKQKASTSLRRA